MIQKRLVLLALLLGLSQSAFAVMLGDTAAPSLLNLRLNLNPGLHGFEEASFKYSFVDQREKYPTLDLTGAVGSLHWVGNSYFLTYDSLIFESSNSTVNYKLEMYSIGWHNPNFSLGYSERTEIEGINTYLYNAFGFSWKLTDRWYYGFSLADDQNTQKTIHFALAYKIPKSLRVEASSGQQNRDTGNSTGQAYVLEYQWNQIVFGVEKQFEKSNNQLWDNKTVYVGWQPEKTGFSLMLAQRHNQDLLESQILGLGITF